MMTRKDYIATAEILRYVSDKTHPAVFSKMVNDFAEMFAKDNDRFDVVKFHKASNYKIPNFSSQEIKMKLQNRERIKKVLEIRRSNAATPIPSKKTYSRKRKHKKTAVGKIMNWD